jgi:hypothetical protein
MISFTKLSFFTKDKERCEMYLCLSKIIMARWDKGWEKWVWNGMGFRKMVLTVMMKCKYGLTTSRICL